MKNNIPTLVLASTLLIGCGSKVETSNTGAQKVGEEICMHSLNILSNDPKNQNSQNFHGKGLLYPIIVDCSTTTKGEASTSAKINYDRSPSLIQPTTGNAQSTTVDKSAIQIKNFAQQINGEVMIGSNVKPYYVTKATPKITITKGTIIGNASAEGRREGGDASLIEKNPKGNDIIATSRAEDIRIKIIKAVEATGATVQGSNNIKVSSKINPLTSSELGLLYEEGLRLEGNGVNRVMDRIVGYNTKHTNSPLLDDIIGKKRFSEASITYTASGVDRTVDTSKWNYAYWLAFVTALGLGVRRITKK